MVYNVSPQRVRELLHEDSSDFLVRQNDGVFVKAEINSLISSDNSAAHVTLETGEMRVVSMKDLYA